MMARLIQNWELIQKQDRTINNLKRKNKKLTNQVVEYKIGFIHAGKEIKRLTDLLNEVEEAIKN